MSYLTHVILPPPTHTPFASSLADLRRDHWSIVAQQPWDTMEWEWGMDRRPFDAAVRRGDALMVTQRRDGEFVLLGKLAKRRPA